MLQAWRARINGEQYMSNYRPRGAAAHAPAQGVCWYVILADGRDAGTVWLQWDGARTGLSLGIFLGEEALFGRGIGSAAINAAIAEARRRHPACVVRLNVRSGNARAIACYKKCGFVAVSSGVKPAPDGKQIRYLVMERKG